MAESAYVTRRRYAIMIKEDIHFRYTLHAERVIKGEQFVNASNFGYDGDRKWLDNASSVHTFIICVTRKAYWI